MSSYFFCRFYNKCWEFAMQGDSSLALRMTLTQCFKKLNCHSEHSEESQTPTFRKEPYCKCFCKSKFFRFFFSFTKEVEYSLNNSLRCSSVAVGVCGFCYFFVKFLVCKEHTAKLFNVFSVNSTH